MDHRRVSVRRGRVRGGGGDMNNDKEWDAFAGNYQQAICTDARCRYACSIEDAGEEVDGVLICPTISLFGR